MAIAIFAVGCLAILGLAAYFCYSIQKSYETWEDE